MTIDRNSTRVITEPVRLSYVHLLEPWSNDPTKKAKYSVVLLIPKDDKVTIGRVAAAKKAAKEAGIARFGASWGKKDLRNTIHDGDEEGDLDSNPEYAGNLYITVSSDTRPSVIDRNGNLITDPDDIYSGCFARVSINAYPYSNSGNVGITFGLNNVMKWRDGDFLGGRSSAESDFADFLGTESEDGEEPSGGGMTGLLG